MSVAEVNQGIIIGADTLVSLDEHVLGKPHSRSDAREMLVLLSGKEHLVLTGLCILDTQTDESAEAVEETFVRFRELSEQEIDSYLDTGEWEDKAGAYAIQGRGALFVEAISGDYFNVMGLPLCRLGLLLKELGVELP